MKKIKIFNDYEALEEKKSLLEDLKKIQKYSETYKINYLIAYLADIITRGNKIDLTNTILEIKESSKI